MLSLDRIVDDLHKQKNTKLRHWGNPIASRVRAMQMEMPQFPSMKPIQFAHQAKGRAVRSCPKAYPKFFDLNLKGKKINMPNSKQTLEDAVNELQLQPVNDTAKWATASVDKVVEFIENNPNDKVRSQIDEATFERAIKYCVHRYGYSSETRDSINRIMDVMRGERLGRRTWLSPFNNKIVYIYSDYSHNHASMCKYQSMMKHPMLPAVDWYEIGRDTDGDILCIARVERLYKYENKKQTPFQLQLHKRVIAIMDSARRSRAVRNFNTTAGLAKRIFRDQRDPALGRDEKAKMHRFTARQLYGNRALLAGVASLAKFVGDSYRLSAQGALMRRNGDLVFPEAFIDYSRRSHRSNDWRVTRQLRGNNYKREELSRFCVVSNPYAITNDVVYKGHTSNHIDSASITPQDIYFPREDDKRWREINKASYIARFDVA